MSEVKPPVQYASAPVAAPSGSQEHYVQHTPVWIVVTRGAQVFFSLIILGMAGAVIHDVMIEELAFGIACVSARPSRLPWPTCADLCYLGCLYVDCYRLRSHHREGVRGA